MSAATMREPNRSYQDVLRNGTLAVSSWEISSPAAEPISLAPL